MKKVFASLVFVVVCVLAYSQGFKDGENLIIGTKGDLGIRRLGTATPGITDGGTTIGAIQAAYNCGTTTTCTPAIPTTKSIKVYGTVTLSSNTATITALPFTSTGSFVCFATDQTTAQLVKAVPASASTATISDTVGATDVIAYECTGT